MPRGLTVCACLSGEWPATFCALAWHVLYVAPPMMRSPHAVSPSAGDAGDACAELRRVAAEQAARIEQLEAELRRCNVAPGASIGAAHGVVDPARRASRRMHGDAPGAVWKPWHGVARCAGMSCACRPCSAAVAAVLDTVNGSADGDADDAAGCPLCP